MHRDPNSEPGPPIANDAIGDPSLTLIPPRLAEELRALHAVEPPGHLVRLVLLQAERDLAAAEVRRRNRFRLQRLAAAAAGVALFVLVARLVTQKPPPAPPAPRGAGPSGTGGAPALAADMRAYDVTGDGSVDILDAFRLARLLEGGTPPGSWDANTDGRVDRADVDAIAMRAVRLGGAS